jgi:ribosomal protein L2
MGKRIIQQARGKGSLTYRVSKKAFSKKIGYPNLNTKGEAEIVSIEHSAAHSAPLMKIKIGDTTFYDPAFNGAFVGQKLAFNTDAKRRPRSCSEGHSSSNNCI